MKSKALLLMVIAGFLPIFACTNPIIEEFFKRDKARPTTPTQEPTPAVTYTVTFDSGGGSPVDSQFVAEGEKATRPKNPEKSGFGFVNWYDNGECAGGCYDFETPVTDDINLYAGWNETFYTVTFDSKGGSDVASQSVGEGGTASRPVPTKEGYTFDDWYSDPELSVLYDFATPVSGGFTLYAKWIPVYTVAFDSRDGSPVEGQTVAEGDTATRPPNPTKSGFGFVNWYDNEALSGSHYDFDTPVSGDITLYAKWSQTFYTVVFVSNGGSDVDDQVVGEGGPASRPVPTKEGYTFDDWYSDLELSVLYDFATPVSGGITLYAKWTLKTYTVTFMDGGTVLDGLTRNAIPHGTAVSRPATDPSKEGQTFDNWYENGLTKPFNFDTKITANTTVYAKFNINTYTVTFMDGETVLDELSQTVTHGSTVDRPETDPTKEGYTFDDWYSDLELNDVYDFDTKITANTTVYAKFNIKTYTVTFMDGDTVLSALTKTVTHGSTVSRPATDPSKEGHTFDNWYENGLTKPFNFDTKITANTTVYAKFNIKTYTVTFMDGGTVLSGLTKTVTHGSTVNKPDDPAKNDHTFDNWYSNSELTTLFNFSNQITANTTVYAKFNINIKTYTVTFNSGGGTPQPPPQTGLIAGAYVASVADPSKQFSEDDLEAGLYRNWPNYAFEGWYDGDTKWDFAAGKVTGDTTLTAKWGASTGNLVPYATVPKNDVAKAVSHANDNARETDRFYLLMDGDGVVIWTGTSSSSVGATVTTLNKANGNLTIIGKVEERTITLSDRTTSDNRILFALDHPSASLTLGNNITLRSRDLSSSDASAPSNSNNPLVRVTRGTLTMENGSKITGHMGGRRYGVVDIYGVEAKFYMKGGQITGNSTSAASVEDAGGRYHGTTAGVFLYDGLFDMSGGSITNNFYNGSTPAMASIDYDLRITTSARGSFSSNPQFKLSGDAKIGSIIFTLEATTTTSTGVLPDTTPHIQLADNFTGSVSALNFSLRTTNLDNVQPAWTSEPVRYFITGPGATAANISKFALGCWCAGGNTTFITSHVLACNPGNGIYLKAK